MPEVAVFLPNLNGGGAERSLLKVARLLSDDGTETQLVLANAVGPYMSEVTPALKLVNLAKSNTIRSVGKLASYLRSAKPTGLLSGLDHANVTALIGARLTLRPLRVVVSVRNTLSAEYATKEGRKEKIVLALTRKLYPSATWITTVSDGVADDAASFLGIDRSKFRTIYNPLLDDDFYAKLEAPVDHPFLQDAGQPCILAVGRLSGQKDYPTLLKALAAVRRQRAARLIILGEGPDLESLQAESKALGVSEVVSFAGFQVNPYPWMKRADLFVLASKFEGLPGVLIQAIGAGTRVVSTDCPSGPSEILLQGEVAPLVPVGDADKLAAAMLHQLSTPTPVYPESVLERFRPESCIRAYKEVLLGN